MSEFALDPTVDNYKVNLEVFSGPLDLLLYLIRNEEVDIYDIPIARITKQYLKYIDLMQTLDLEVAGEFILMAATLIRIKTRLLLPTDDEDGEEADPREELIMALVEYKKYKEAGEILREHALNEERYYLPPAPVEKIDGRVDLEPVTSLFDLITAFKEVIENQHREESVHQVSNVEVTIEDRMTVILELIRKNESATFLELFSDIPRKAVAIVTFVALLELARSRRIRLYQAVPFSEVRVYPGELIDVSHLEIDLVEVEDNDEKGNKSHDE